jgi:hypothetical protein
MSGDVRLEDDGNNLAKSGRGKTGPLAYWKRKTETQRQIYRDI